MGSIHAATYVRFNILPSFLNVIGYMRKLAQILMVIEKKIHQ